MRLTYRVISGIISFAVAGVSAVGLAAEGGQGFIGANFGVGESFASKPGSPGVSYDMTIEPGYMVPLGSWARAEASLEAGFGQLGYRAAKSDDNFSEQMTITTLGVMPKLGYGYSLGNDLFGVWKVGVGPQSLKYSGKDQSGDHTFSGNILAVGIRGEFAVVLPASSGLDFTAGVKVTHLSADLGDTTITDNNVSTKVDLGSLNLNVVEAMLGARLKF